MPQLSVIVPTWNGRGFLDGCLASLEAQTARESMEVIVVDNGSADDTREMVAERYPSVRVIALPENRGFAGGCNAGIRAAHAPLIALLNNDAETDARWAERLLEAADAHPGAGSFACAIRQWVVRDRLESCGDFFSVFGWAGHLGLHADAAAYVPSMPFGPCAGAAMYRASALEDAGLFDEAFFVSHEDVDLAFRLRLRGHPCVAVPDAIVFHRGFATRHRNAGTLFLSRRNQLFVLWKNLPALLWILLLPLLLLGQLLGLHSRFVRIGMLRACAVTLRARLAALRFLPAMLRTRRGIQRRRRVSALAVLRMMTWRP